uniref:Torsin-1A-interacting protein 1/2 AAA+ activator domain-containing protein n=1 Tax=Plectus sambesii TaxID=2011161 RepID=A0A914WZC1_9BILA
MPRRLYPEAPVENFETSRRANDDEGKDEDEQEVEEEQGNEQEQEHDHNYDCWQNIVKYKLHILLIIGTVLLAILLCYPISSETSAEYPNDAMALYNEGIKKLINRYGSQDDDSLLVLRAAGTHVFSAAVVEEPAVVLLAGDPSTVTCFAQQLAEIALSTYRLDPAAYPSTTIDGASSRLSDAASAKKQLDQQLSSSLSRHRVVTLLGLDSLPGDSPLMLHTYCDHENAPFKDAFIILTANVNTDSVVGLHACDAAVHTALEARWKNQPGLNREKIGALWARIGNSVVCLRSLHDIIC